MAPAGEYDGGQPVNPPDKAGQDITLVDIPKLIGIGYFDATAKGMQEAAAELGNVTVINDGPDRSQHRRADHLHRQLHHPGRRWHPVRRQRPGRHRPGAGEGPRAGIHVVGYDANSDARCARVVRQPGRVQRHRQGHDRQHRCRAGRGCAPSASSPAPSPRPTRRAGLPRCRRTQRKMLPEHEVARNCRGPGRQHPVLQPGDRRSSTSMAITSGSVRHDQRGDPGGCRSRDPGRPVRQGRGGRSGDPERHEDPTSRSDCVKSVVLWNPIDLGYAAVYVMRAVVDGKLPPATRRRSWPSRRRSRSSTAAKCCSARRSSTTKTTSTTSTSSQYRGDAPRESPAGSKTAGCPLRRPAASSGAVGERAVAAGLLGERARGERRRGGASVSAVGRRPVAAGSGGIGHGHYCAGLGRSTVPNPT